jgi:hypothetical protein
MPLLVPLDDIAGVGPGMECRRVAESCRVPALNPRTRASNLSSATVLGRTKVNIAIPICRSAPNATGQLRGEFLNYVVHGCTKSSQSRPIGKENITVLARLYQVALGNATDRDIRKQDKAPRPQVNVAVFERQLVGRTEVTQHRESTAAGRADLDNAVSVVRIRRTRLIRVESPVPCRKINVAAGIRGWTISGHQDTAQSTVWCGAEHRFRCQAEALWTSAIHGRRHCRSAMPMILRRAHVPAAVPDL